MRSILSFSFLISTALVVGAAAPTSAWSLPTTLPCNSTLTRFIPSPAAQDTLAFDLSAGEKIEITLAKQTGTPAFNPMYRLLDSSGNEVLGWRPPGRAEDCGPYPPAGSPYRLEVADEGADGSGTYNVRLQRLSSATACEAYSLPCNATQTRTLTDGLDSDLFTFNVSQGEKVEIAVAPEVGAAEYFPMYRVLDSSGNVVLAWRSPDRAEDCGPYPPAGNPYRLEVADEESNGRAAGTYSVRLQRLSSATACEAYSLPCNATQTRTLTDGLDSDLFTFNVSQGEKVEITVAPEVGAAEYFPMYRVLDSSGNVVLAWRSPGRAEDCGPYPPAGNPYRLEVADEESNGRAAGTYSVRLQRLSSATACEAYSLPCNATQIRTLTDGLDSDLFTFNVSQGEKVEITVAQQVGAAEYGPMYRVLDSSGNVVLAWRSPGRAEDCGPYPPAGNPYRLEVADEESNGRAAGTYSVRLQRLSSATACEAYSLPCNATQTRTLTDGLDSDLFTFNVSQGEKVEIAVAQQVGAAEYFPMYRLLDSSGNVVLDWRSPNREDCGPLLLAGSPYRLEVADDESNGRAGGTYSVSLQRLAAVPGCGQPLWTCQPAGCAIDSPVDACFFTFLSRDSIADTISVGAESGTDFQPIWRLLKADGTAAEDCGTYHSGSSTCSPSALGAPFRIEIVDSGLDGTGVCTVTIGGCNPTSTPDPTNPVPTRLMLHQNAPNPFNPSTAIRFSMPDGGRAVLAILDVSGRRVRTLLDGILPAGEHLKLWDGRGERGNAMPSGIYLYQLRTPAGQLTRRMILIR